jgi:4-amino-4-deoxy-L-arabinose transferase-like glycosyltransferase
MNPSPSRLPLWAAAALLVIFALALSFRLCDLGGRNLWTDEAWVAQAALQDSPAAALPAGRSTPPLYLLSVWAAVKVLGGSEVVLRSVSFLLGLGTLVLFWLLARSLMPLPASLLALAAVAFSPVLVYYAKELKQYSGDACFAVLIFYLAERLRTRRGQDGWAALGLAGVLGLGFSHPLVFVLPVAGVALWFSLPRRRSRLALLGGVWALAFAVYYLLFFRREVDPNLLAYWTEVAAFPDFSGIKPLILWLGQALYEYFWYFLGEWGLYWGPPLLAAGAGALIYRRQGRILAYLLGPLVLALAAAALHRYPFMARCGGNRLMLFSAPFLYLVAAAGAAAVLAWLWQKRQRWLALVLSAVLLAALHPVANFRENLFPHNNREQIQPLVERLSSQLRPGDLVYVYYFAIQPFQYYYHGPAARLCLSESCVETNLKVADAPDGAPRRIWLIASHIEGLQDLRDFAARLLGPEWREAACFTRQGAALFRFEPQQPSVAAKPPSLPEPAQSGSPTPPPGRAY